MVDRGCEYPAVKATTGAQPQCEPGMAIQELSEIQLLAIGHPRVSGSVASGSFAQ